MSARNEGNFENIAPDAGISVLEESWRIMALFKDCNCYCFIAAIVLRLLDLDKVFI